MAVTEPRENGDQMSPQVRYGILAHLGGKPMPREVTPSFAMLSRMWNKCGSGVVDT